MLTLSDLDRLTSRMTLISNYSIRNGASYSEFLLIIL